MTKHNLVINVMRKIKPPSHTINLKPPRFYSNVLCTFRKLQRINDKVKIRQKKNNGFQKQL